MIAPLASERGVAADRAAVGGSTAFKVNEAARRLN
jgi:hypothetical protein